jgi:hypothetical protein
VSDDPPAKIHAKRPHARRLGRATGSRIPGTVSGVDDRTRLLAAIFWAAFLVGEDARRDGDPVPANDAGRGPPPPLVETARRLAARG